MVTPLGTYAAVRFGIPHPRFTQAPSGSSSAARSAICSRVNRRLDIAQSFRYHDAVHVNERRDNVFRIERTDFHNFVNFHEGHTGCGGHNRIEIAGAFSKHQIAQPVGLMRFNERIIRADGLLQNVALATDDAFLFSVGNFRAYADWRKECGNSGAVRAHSFAENTLRHQFEFHLSLIELLLKVGGAWSGKGGGDAANLLILEKYPQFPVASAAVVADYAEVFGAFPGQALNQVVWKAGAAEAAKHNRGAIGNIRNHRVNRRIDLIFWSHR